MHKTLCLLVLLLAALPSALSAQCGTTVIVGNFAPANGDTLSGTYDVSGNLDIPAGVTVYVRPFSVGGCGEVVLLVGGNANVGGSILAVGAGYPGGTAGLPGTVNNAAFIEACPAPTDQCGDVITFGGGQGGNANPGGGGAAGQAGQNGGGRKNQCLNFGDVGGRVGGSGGGGAGAGGTYAGTGNAGAAGGAASLATMSTSDPSCTNFPITAGNGGNGGNPGIAYGTLSGFDIDLGSGGGGAGGGGRGRFPGTNGEAGGAGGGLVRLQVQGDLVFTGLVNASGTDGGKGGDGGNGGSSPRCCTDLCAGVDEYTHTGAGGGGGGAGGGSGGGILFQVNGIATVTGQLLVDGGNGGAGGLGGGGSSMNQNACFTSSNANMPPANPGNSGGGGAAGRIKVFYNDCAPGNNVVPTTSTAGGNGNGGNAGAGTVYLGTDGSFVIGAAQPALQTVCYQGDPGNLNALPASGGYGAITYQWQAQFNCTGPWQNIPGATQLNYDPPAGLTDTTCFRLEVSSGLCIEYTDTLTVDVIPPQSATVNPAGPLVLCQGDSLPLTTSGGTGAIYQWSYNGVPIPAATDSFWVATNTGDYTVEIQYPVGCAGLSAPVNLTFAPPPAGFIFVAGDTLICPGDSVELQAAGQGSFQWWYNGTPIAGATGSSIFASQAGQYLLEVSTAGGCTSRADSVQLTLGTQPNAGLVASGPLNFCEGDSVQLEATGGTSYQWLFNGLPIAGTGATLFAGQTGAYQAIAVGADGCTDTSAVVQVLVDPVPDAQLTTAGLPVACQGDSVLFLASGGGSYAWFYNQAALPDTTAYLYADNPGDYFVVVTSAAGCQDTSVTYAFTWYPPVPVSAAIQGPPYLCAGDSLEIQGSAPGQLSYQWTLNDTALAGETSPNLTAFVPGLYELIVTSANGCTYSSGYLNVFPGNAPQAEIDPQGDLPACDGDSVLLLGAGGVSYAWYIDGLQVPGATSDSLWATISGDYSLVVTTGCGTDTSPDLQVILGAGPVAGFVYQNHPANEVHLIDQSISGATWWWDFGDGSPTATDQNPMHTYPGPGEYLVTMITWDIFGCSDTIAQTIMVADPNYFIPNVFTPNGDGINDVLEVWLGSLENISFRIFDRWGREVFLTYSNQAGWDGKKGTADCPDGVYYWQLVAKDANGQDVKETGNITLLR